MWMTKQFTNKNISSMVSDTQVFIIFLKKHCETAYFWNEKGKSSATFPVPLMPAVPGSVCHTVALHEKWQRWLPKKFHECQETSLVIYYIMWGYFPNFVGTLEYCLYTENSRNWYAYLDYILKRRESFIAYCLFSQSVHLCSDCSIFWGSSQFSYYSHGMSLPQGAKRSSHLVFLNWVG